MKGLRVSLLTLVSAFLSVSPCFPCVATAPPGVRDQQALGLFERIPNLASPDYLDDFVSNCRGTPTADLAFTLRYQLVHTSSSIDAYNDFISRYPTTVPGRLAVGEVYDLYARRDTVAGYFDFMRRYPNSVFALHAKTRAQTLLFGAAYKLVMSGRPVDDAARIAVLDNFILSNPDAAEVQTAASLATTIAVNAEKKHWKDELERLSKDVAGAYSEEEKKQAVVRLGIDAAIAQKSAKWESDRANVLSHELEKLASELGSEPAERTPRSVLLHHRYQREATRLLEVYPEQPASSIVRVEDRHREIKKELRDLREELKKENEKLIQTLSDEFEHTRDAIRSGFKETVAGLKTLDESVRRAEQTLAQVSSGIYELNAKATQQLEESRRAGQDLAAVRDLVGRGLQQSAAQAERLHKDLRAVSDSIRKMDVGVNASLHWQTVQLERVSAGVNEMGRLQEQGIVETRRTREALVRELGDLKDVTSEGFRDTRNRLDGLIAQEARAHYDAMVGDQRMAALLQGLSGGPTFQLSASLPPGVMASDAMGRLGAAYLGKLNDYASLARVASECARAEDPKGLLMAGLSAASGGKAVDPAALSGQGLRAACAGLGGRSNDCQNLADMAEVAANLYSGDLAGAFLKAASSPGDGGDAVRGVVSAASDVVESVLGSLF